MSYYEISRVKAMEVKQDADKLAIEFDNGTHLVMVELTIEQFQQLNKLALNYCPGMPGFIQFHEQRLNQAD